MMEGFTPVSALVGGVLIGAASALLLIVNGRIAGISGILGGLLQPQRGELGWRLAFLAGLLSAPLLFVAVGGTLPPVSINASVGLLVVAGLFVGFGGRFGGWLRLCQAQRNTAACAAARHPEPTRS